MAKKSKLRLRRSLLRPNKMDLLGPLAAWLGRSAQPAMSPPNQEVGDQLDLAIAVAIAAGRQAERARIAEIVRLPGAGRFPRLAASIALARALPSSKRSNSSPPRNPMSSRAGSRRNLPFLKAPHGCFIKSQGSSP